MEKKTSYTFTPWIIFAGTLCVLQAIASIMTIAMALKAGMLPAMYLAVLAVFLLLTMVLVFFMLLKTEIKFCRPGYNGKKNYVKRGIGTVISVIVLIVCMALLFVFDQAISVIKSVTEIPETVTENVYVYVMADDPAQTIQDAAHYTFGITENYDYENTKETIVQINANLGKEIDTHSYEDVLTLTGALYEQKVGAIIMNEAYASMVEEYDEYADFAADTRILEVIEVEHEVEEAEETEDENGYHYAKIRDIDLTEDPFVVYISGNDTRELKLAKSRSDVNILMVVNPKTKRIFLLNTPRDYFVDTAEAPGNMDKLTHCGLYGTKCSMDTLCNLYGGIPVDRYVQVNFTGFVKLIDAIGGITVNCDTAFSMGGYSFKVGENQLDGEAALCFARERHAFSDGDNARGRHQMEIISAVITKLTHDYKVIGNYADIMDSLEGMISTDITSAEITDLVRMQLTDMQSWEVTSYAVTGTDGDDYTYSAPYNTAYVMIPDEEMVEKASDMVNSVLEGGTSY